mmetsp:Transcript_8471/g.25291  ORF Transcript_8471/g.25291 Transcript_8471/m.25291 type:complete len:405 (-) Transcript_8471:113-1327(-)
MGCTSSKNAEREPKRASSYHSAAAPTPRLSQKQVDSPIPGEGIPTPSGKSIRSPVDSPPTSQGMTYFILPATEKVEAIEPERTSKTSTLPAAGPRQAEAEAAAAVGNILGAAVHEAAEILERRSSEERDGDAGPDAVAGFDMNTSPRRSAYWLGCTAEEIFWDAELCRSDPKEGLYHFLTQNRVRTDAFFKILDKNNAKQVTQEEFVKQVVALGMPLHPVDDRELLDGLAGDIAGHSNGKMISYLDVSTMRKECQLVARERRKSVQTPESLARDSSFHGAFMSPERATPSSLRGTPSSLRDGASPASSSASPRRPTEIVREEQRSQNRDAAESYDKHLERQMYLEQRKSLKKTKTSAKAKQDGFQERLHKARLSTKIGPKRTHPFLDRGGAGAVNRTSTSAKQR